MARNLAEVKALAELYDETHVQALEAGHHAHVEAHEAVEDVQVEPHHLEVRSQGPPKRRPLDPSLYCEMRGGRRGQARNPMRRRRPSMYPLIVRGVRCGGMMFRVSRLTSELCGDCAREILARAPDGR